MINTNEISTKNIKVYAEDAKMNFNYVNDQLISISIDEKDDLYNIEKIIEVFAKAKKQSNFQEILDNIIRDNVDKKHQAIPNELIRKSQFLQYDVFNSYHSETELMRYIKSLENK